MNFENFLHIIWKQKPAGYDGFEGLVAKLLERLTGQCFYLSLSGRQEGRDLASNSLMVECKRYDDSTSLKSDELLLDEPVFSPCEILQDHVELGHLFQ
jgi:hypothetical protein